MLKSVYESIFKKKWDFYTYILAGAALLAVVQLAVICWLNLTQMPFHMGYDASTNYLKAAELWRQGTLFPQNWVDQNILLFDSAVLPAALFYGLCGDLLTAYGLANIFMTACLVLAFWGLARSLRLSPLAALIALNLFLCPYISGAFSNTNDLGWFSMLFTSGGFYSVRVTASILAVKTVLDIKSKRSARVCIPLAVGSVLLAVLCGASSGLFFGVTVLAPLVIYLVVDAIAKNKPRDMISWAMLFAVGALVLSAAARMAISRLTGFDSKDMTMSLIEPENLLTNAVNVVLGFMILIGAYAPMGKVEVLSGTGVSYLTGLVLFGICIIAVVSFAFALKKYIKNSAFAPLFVIIIFNFLLLAFVDTSYSQALFEHRYLVFSYVCVIFLIARYIDSLRDATAYKKAGVLLLFVCMLGLTAISDYRYAGRRNNYDVLQGIVESTREYDAKAVYVLAGEDDETVVAGKNLRAIDLEREYKLLYNDHDSIIHWGDYTRMDDIAASEGGSLVIAAAGELEKLPAYRRDSYTLLFESGGFFVYYSETNRFDLNHKVLRGVNRELADSPILFAENGGITETGTYLSDGTEGFCLSGSTMYTQSGTYDVTLNYRIHETVSENPAEFAVFVDEWDNTVGRVTLSADAGSVTVQGVKLTDYCKFGCFAAEAEGTVLEIFSIDIVSVG